MKWTLMWLNWNEVTLNVTLQLLDIYRWTKLRYSTLGANL